MQLYHDIMPTLKPLNYSIVSAHGCHSSDDDRDYDETYARTRIFLMTYLDIQPHHLYASEVEGTDGLFDALE